MTWDKFQRWHYRRGALPKGEHFWRGALTKGHFWKICLCNMWKLPNISSATSAGMRSSVTLPWFRKGKLFKIFLVCKVISQNVNLIAAVLYSHIYVAIYYIWQVCRYFILPHHFHMPNCYLNFATKKWAPSLSSCQLLS